MSERPTEVARIFADEAAITRLVGAVLRDCQEFRVGAAIVDPTEVPDGTTQSTPYP